MKINEIKKQMNQAIIEMDLDDVLFLMKAVLLKYNDELVSERTEAVKNSYDYFGDVHGQRLFELEEFMREVGTYREQARYMIEREETLRIRWEEHLSDKAAEYMDDDRGWENGI